MAGQKGNGLQRPDVPADVVAAAQAGDEGAFGQIVAHYQRAVFAIAWRMTHDAAQAEDLAQEVFLRVWRKLDSFRPSEPLKPWLLRLATNACINALKRRRLPMAAARADEDAAPFDPPDDAPQADEIVARRELAERLEAAIAELPEDYRLVVTLRHVEDLSYEEIAAILRAPLGTVKVRLHRARERLRRLLGPLLGDER